MPIWNLEIPSPVVKFLNNHDWRGIRIWPFYTSGGIYRYTPHKLKEMCQGARIERELIVIFNDTHMISYVQPEPIDSWYTRIRSKEHL